MQTEKNRANIVNFTPHDIVVFDANGNPAVRFPVSGTIARIIVSHRDLPALEPYGVPQVEELYERIADLPEETPGTFFIVSRPIAQIPTTRADLLVPANLVRDSNGAVIGCTALARIRHPKPAGSESSAAP